MKGFYNKKKVLITGHTGFKGAWLTQILLTWGADVVGVSLPPNTEPNLFSILGLEKKIKNYFSDIQDLEKMRAIFKAEKPEIVFHLAAQPIVRTSYDDPIGTFSTNVMGTAHILEVIKEVGCVKSVIIITTDKVYENKEWHYAYRENDPLGGHDPYSSSKAAADIVANSYIQSFFNPNDFGVKHNTLVAIARAGNVIGGGDWAEYRLIPDVIKAIYHTDTHVEIRNPESVRPWQHVLEPLSGYLMLAQELHQKKVLMSGAWNFGPNNDSFVSVRALAEGAKEILGKGEYVISPDTTKHEATLLKLDINKAIALLGWKPTLSFKQTLDLTFTWYKNYYEKSEDVVVFTNQQINTFFK
jgi:CDP-glucose 4,6-dehydratase